MAGSGLRTAAAVVLALVGAGGAVGTDAGATPAATMAGMVGQPISLARVPVGSVCADEGFWVISDHGRMWIQIDTNRESPYTVRDGDLVSLSGVVVAHDPGFPARVGVTAGEGAGDLAAQGAHVVIPVTGLAFNT